MAKCQSLHRRRKGKVNVSFKMNRIALNVHLSPFLPLHSVICVGAGDSSMAMVETVACKVDDMKDGE